MQLRLVVLALLVPGLALADPKVSVTPKKVTPGAPVLVSVSGSKDTPKGTAAGTDLIFYKTKAGYQAVVAIPLDTKPGDLVVAVAGAKDVKLPVKAKTFPKSKVVVEEEMANPGPTERDKIDADNVAIIKAMKQDADTAPLFTASFKKPAGKTTSVFGEWRTFNDGHSSQHLGLDVDAKEGANVRAPNSGKVTLVREGFLTGNIVVIAHGGGVATAYFHLQSAKVAEGAEVARGDVIGAAGMTGRTTGPHVHVAVRVPGGLVDPEAFFKLKVSPVRTIAPVR